MTARRVPSPEAIERAVRLSHVPQVALAEAARVAGVSVAAFRRARKGREVRLTRDDLILAVLTGNGARSEGPIGDAGGIAAWLDCVNHDGSTAEEVERDLARLVAEGRLALEGDRFRLLRPWP